MKKLRELIYIISFLIFRILSFIIPFRLYLGLIQIISSITNPFYCRRKSIARENLLYIEEFSKDQISSVIDEGIKNVSLLGLMDVYMDRLFPEICKKYVTIEGEDNLKQAIAKKIGVLLAFVHSNAHNVALPCIGAIEKVHCVVTLNDSDRLSTIHSKLRGSMWESPETLTYIYLKKKESAAFKICRLLKDTKVVAITADGRHTSKFLSVPFFDKKIRLPMGVFMIGTKLQVPIVPLFSGFDRKQRMYRVKLGKPILSQSSETAAEEFSARFQEHLKQYPSHWTGWWRMKLVKDDRGDEVFHIYSV